MGTPVHLTSFFRDDDGHGFSESHVVDGGSIDPDLTSIIATYSDFNKIYRAPLLAGDGYYLGCRASYRHSNGKISASPNFPNLAVRGTQTIGSVLIEMNECSDAIKIRFQNSNSQANADIYLRGVWDDIIQAGQLNFGGAVGGAFQTALTAYENKLKSNQYGWLGIDPLLTTRGDVTGYTQNALGTVTFVVARTLGPVLPAAGTRITVRLSKLNGGKSILNRTFVCVVDAGGLSVTTLKKVQASVFQTAGSFTALVKSLILYDHVARRSPSSRKTGRPFGVGRGRLSAATLH